MTCSCDVCKETVFTGRAIYYEYPPGNWKDEIEGEMEHGAGECEVCSKYFCEDHNKLEDGLCPDCLEQEEDGYVPF